MSATLKEVAHGERGFKGTEGREGGDCGTPPFNPGGLGVPLPASAACAQTNLKKKGRGAREGLGVGRKPHPP